MTQSSELTEEQLRALFAWIDAIPLSRPKRNIARDFSDGVLVAEVIHAYFPNLIDVHNYVTTNSVKQKIYNFETLNKKVLKRLGYVIPRELIEDTVTCKTGSIESLLNTLQLKMAKYREKKLASDAISISGTTRREDDNNSCRRVPIVATSSNITKRENTNPLKTNTLSYVSEQLLIEKDLQIKELQETIEILSLKVNKLEQLVRLKDVKMQKLSQG